MENTASEDLCPLYLYLYSDSEPERRQTWARPSEINREDLDKIIKTNCGVDNAILSGRVYYENCSFNMNRVFSLRSSNDIAQLKAQFETLKAAKVGVAVTEKSNFAISAFTGSEADDKKVDSRSVSIPAEQLDNLIQSMQKLEVSLNNSQQKKVPSQHKTPDLNAQHYKTVHYQVVCDGCHPEPQNGVPSSSQHSSKEGYIKGPRYKCLYCYNYDLCSDCVVMGVETGTHKKYHNLVQINAPDADINKLWSKLNADPVSNNGGSKFGVNSSEKDVVIDIPEENTKLIEFFSNIKTADELTQLIDHHEKYEELLAKVGGQAAELHNAIELYLSSKNGASLDDSVETARGEEAEEDLIEVEMSKRDHVISFRLLNKGPTSVPSGTRLVFQYFKPQGAFPVKCTLHVGPHEFQKGSYKTLNFNCRGLIDNFSMANTCKIDLIDHEDQVIFTGTSSGGSAIFLRPPLMLDIQNSVYTEAREAPELGPDSLEDEDIISNTVTNEGSRHDSHRGFDSELDEYDFLSDSDIET